uniref:ATP synthase subunit a n=1 Tax=Acanthogyrus cheni TaxID=1381719 RepID=A0A1W5Q0L5_9BILA|nr:ATP synthase F0 subunit 6 [Acanthogyrus cheni]
MGFYVSVMNPSDSLKGVFLWFCMFVLVVLNYCGFVLSETVTMSFGLVLYVSFVFWASSLVVLVSVLGLNKVLSHFLPSGLSGVFMVVMPVLELISWAVRPLTLGVRLAVNITSGHVLVMMLAYFASAMSFVVFVGLVVVLMLEFVVAYLQGYIYVSLLVLYSS